MLVTARVAGEEPARECDERNALQVGPVARLRGVLLVAKQRLEPMSVSQCLGGERGHDLAEANVGIGERLGVAVGAQEDRADHRALPLDRHDDDRSHVSRAQRGLDAAERRVGGRIGNEHRLARLEGALELGVAIQIDDEVANRRILVAGDEPDFLVFAGEEDRAAIEPERLAQLAGDRLENVDEVKRGGDFLQDVDDRDEVVALALQLGYARAQPADLILSAIGARRLRLGRGRGSLRLSFLRLDGLWRRLSVLLLHLPPQCAR